MSNVYFASAEMKELHAEASLPAKLPRMLDELPMREMLDGKTYATGHSHDTHNTTLSLTLQRQCEVIIRLVIPVRLISLIL